MSTPEKFFREMNAMRVRDFLDTNIFVYSFSPEEKSKYPQAKKLIAEALATGNGIISTQVIQEFFNVATRKFVTPLRREDAVTYLHEVLSPLCMVFPNQEYYELALKIQSHYEYSFYDSLIIAAARLGGCRRLLTEDMRTGQRVEGMLIVNPFVNKERG